MPGHLHIISNINEPFQLADVIRDFEFLKTTDCKSVEAVSLSLSLCLCGQHGLRLQLSLDYPSCGWGFM